MPPLAWFALAEASEQMYPCIQQMGLKRMAHGVNRCPLVALA